MEKWLWHLVEPLGSGVSVYVRAVAARVSERVAWHGSTRAARTTLVFQSGPSKSARAFSSAPAYL